jgi:RNA polymerase sigma factor (sigma-70 family)
MRAGTPVDGLLANAAWLGRLARRLADEGDAEDIAQATWLACLRSPPDPTRPSRPWLAEVLRNFARMQRRSSARRRDAPADVQALAAEGPSPEERLATAELHQRLAGLVSALDEPYRTVVLLRFYEGLTTSALALRLGVPPGTARWRLSEAVRRLRAALDGADPASRWRALALLSLRGRRPGLAPLAVACSALLLVGLAGQGCWAHDRATSVDHGPGSPRPAAAVGHQPNETVVEAKMKRMTILLGAVLPTLLAASRNEDPPITRDEFIIACSTASRRSAECEDAFTEDAVERWLAHDAPPEVTEEQIAEYRAVRLRRAARGHRPLEVLRQECATLFDEGAPQATVWRSHGQAARWQLCQAKPDCRDVVECINADPAVEH